MASWTSLPINVKKKIVKELDLLTRCRLKISSCSNRDLVNSVPLTIKNARIGLADDACLLMIHTGIGEFVKLDLELIKGKVVIKRSINSYDKGKRIPTSHKDLLAFTCLLMKSLLFSPTKNIFLKRFEWELDPSASEHILMTRVPNLLAGVKFRVEKLVLNQRTSPEFNWFVNWLCAKEDLKLGMEQILNPLVRAPFPSCLLGLFMPIAFGAKPWRMCQIEQQGELKFYEAPDELLASVIEMPENYLQIRGLFLDPKKAFDEIRAPCKRLTDKILVKRQIIGELAHRHILTPCGYSFAVIHESAEDSVDWTADPCGMAELCPSCTDPFEYCYVNNLAHRAVREPKWLNIFVKLPGRSDHQSVMTRTTELMDDCRTMEEILEVGEVIKQLMIMKIRRDSEGVKA